MTVQQVIDLAVGGELKGLAVKDDVSSIIGFINLGLIELYKRFPLKVEEHIITLVDGVEIYTMPTDFMWIVAAYDEVTDGSSGVLEVAINEEDNPLSLNTISWNQVQVPTMIDGAFISVIYVATPGFLTTSPADLDSAIELPDQMVEALLHYIGYRAHNAITGEVNAEHTTHYTRFEASCARIETMGMFTGDDVSMQGRLTTRGFV